MSELKDFLLTANADNDLALAEAKVYTETKGRLISPDMMLAFLTSFNHIDILDGPLENELTPVTKEAKGLRKAFSFGSEFNLIDSHPASVIPMLNQMETDELVSQAFIDYCVAYANEPFKPFENITLTDVLRARDVMTYAQVTPINGYAVISVASDVPLHNPMLIGLNPRTGKTQRINNFMRVEKAGVYDCQVPRENLSWSLSVENAYGVVS